MIKKQHIAIFVFVIILYLGFDIFAFTHLAKYAKLLSIGIGGLGFVLFAYFFKQYPKSLRTFGLLFLGVLFLSILTAQQLHHQSILSGIIANSAIPVMGLSFIAYYLLIKYSISLEKLKQTILKASWILLFVFFFLFIRMAETIPMYLVRRPANHLNTLHIEALKNILRKP